MSLLDGKLQIDVPADFVREPTIQKSRKRWPNFRAKMARGEKFFAELMA